MTANIFRIYPVEALASMKTHLIVLLKRAREYRLRVGRRGREGGGVEEEERVVGDLGEGGGGTMGVRLWGE